jgi:very-long-chain (3R)-3-hydroxyacyl-CoA dehydratase
MIASGKDIGVKEGVPGLYDEIQYELRVYQTLAFLEVIHCMIGIVRSSPFTTFMQVYSRLLVLWGIIEGVPEVGQYYHIYWCIFGHW